MIRLDNGSTLQTATVEVVALDGEKVVAQANLDVQILDDSEEFVDPRPDASRLATLARLSGGSVLQGPDDLARLLEQSTEAADKVVTSRSPSGTTRWYSPWSSACWRPSGSSGGGRAWPDARPSGAVVSLVGQASACLDGETPAG